MSVVNGKRLIFVNAILAVCILSVLYIKFYKKNVLIDVERGHSLKGIFEVLESKNLRFTKNLQIFFIFNTRPTLSSLEDIDKLYHIYGKEDVDFCAIFSSPFRLLKEFHAPHHFFIRYNILYLDSFEHKNDAPQLIITNDKKVVFADRILGFLQLSKALEWQIHPSPYEPVQLSREDLRTILLDRIKRKNIALLDVYTRNSRLLDSILASGIDELYIIHAACIGCELNKLLFNISELRNRKTVIVLSVHANGYDIKAILESQKIKTDVFIDYQDGLGLLHADVKEQNNLFIFARKEFLY